MLVTEIHAGNKVWPSPVRALPSRKSENRVDSYVPVAFACKIHLESSRVWAGCSCVGVVLELHGAHPAHPALQAPLFTHLGLPVGPAKCC